ncbi:MAG: hypothetical protein K2X87_27430 [Gemmataceae bacterium]|nr:hypothetical protein [Gemmataceae bacterium]
MRLLAGSVLVAVVLTAAGRGQPPAAPADKVYVRDKANRDAAPKAVEGELKATAAGFQIVGAKSVSVSPADIVRVVPGDVPGVERKDITDLAALEDKREWAKARDGYAKLLEKSKGGADKTRRYLGFKLASTSARAADDTPDDAGWKDKAEAAAGLLGQYLAENPGGWEAWPAGRAAARLDLELGQPAKAAEVWGRVGKGADLPAELKAEAAVQEVEALIRAKRYGDAASRATAAEGATPAGPPRDRLALLQLAAKAEANPLSGAESLEGEVAKAKDPAVRATGRLAQAELYLAADRPRDAMWALLWVEVVENGDREEVAKAVARLADVFRVLGDEDRAKSYRDKLRRLRAGL